MCLLFLSCLLRFLLVVVQSIEARRLSGGLESKREHEHRTEDHPDDREGGEVGVHNS